MFTVTVKDKHNNPVDSVECRADSCTIGRSGKNLIRINGWRIDGVHAELQHKKDGIYITDRSSGAGLKVGGKKVASAGPLGPADGIAIGSFLLTVCDNEAVESPDKEPDTPPPDFQPSVPTPVTASSSEPVFQEAPPEEQTSTTLYGESSDGGNRWHKMIQQQLMQAMDLRRTDVESMNEQQLKEAVRGLIKEIIKRLDSQLPPELDRERLAREVLHEAVGLGPLEDFLADDSISEIMVNRFDDIYVEQHGLLHKTKVAFSSNQAVLSVIERIVSPLGRRIDESSPMVDGRLQDGSRINAVIPPLSIHGPCLTIRKFFRKKLTTDDLIAFGSLSQAMVDFLRTAVHNRKNVVISGGTGSGKTTFLNVISGFIPHSERIVTVEDSAELQLEQPHVVSLEARPANMEGKGAVTIRDLVRNCLRMRPDRIVVGECRGGEALDMLQAMNTGHDGSLTTVHANSPRDLISRLEVMVMMSGMELPDQAIREQITSAVDIIVQQARFVDGSRRITHITEVTGQESGVIQMQDIFVFKQQGFDEAGRVVGTYIPTGRVPEFYEELRQRGLTVDMSIFEQ